MIVAIGADKGSPGATTLAVLFGMVWPTERAVLELDPRGADLPYRLARADGQPLAASPSVASVAVDARPGTTPRALSAYAQPTALGVPVIAGETSLRRFARLAPHLPGIAAAAVAWSGTALVDLGPLTVSNPALLPVARAATVTVLVSRADTESLGRLREHIDELASELGRLQVVRPPVAVVVRAERGEDRRAATRVGKLLASIGSPVPVVGTLPCDMAGADALWATPPAGRFRRSPLMAAARMLTDQLHTLWPELAESPPPSPEMTAVPLAPSEAAR